MTTTTPAGTGELVLTGERTLPGIPDENYWFRRHEAAYRELVPWLTGAAVLEAGCGEGYGADLLRRSGAGPVTALDADPATARHAARTYPGVSVVRGDLERLPFGAGSFGAVATLQTIEHLHDQERFVAECARVLRPAGLLVVSTPNRLTFSPGDAPPLNPFHTRELSAAELVELISPWFAVNRVLGLRHGRRLTRDERRTGPLVDTQIAQPPDAWGPALRHVVHAVRANDFAVSAADVDSCLDLIVIAWRRP